jgi:SAM-dependent methyltransferase
MTQETSGRETLRRQREHWDMLAARMPDMFPAFSTQYYRLCEISLIQRSVGSLAGRRVLKMDLWNEACNTRILNWMEAQGAQVFGLDVSGIVVRRARSNTYDIGGELHPLQADIRNLPYNNGSFDLVYAMGTIEHIDEYAQAVAEVFRVLKPGGLAIVGVPHRWNIFLRPLLVSVLSYFGKYPYCPERSFSAAQLRRLMIRQGFESCRRTGILAFPGIIRMADIFFFRRNIPLHRLTPLFLWPFRYLETRWTWPGYFGYLLVMVGKKDALQITS